MKVVSDMWREQVSDGIQCWFSSLPVEYIIFHFKLSFQDRVNFIVSILHFTPSSYYQFPTPLHTLEVFRIIEKDGQFGSQLSEHFSYYIFYKEIVYDKLEFSVVIEHAIISDDMDNLFKHSFSQKKKPTACNSIWAFV